MIGCIPLGQPFRGGLARRRRPRDASVCWQKLSGQRPDLRFTNLLRTCRAENIPVVGSRWAGFSCQFPRMALRTPLMAGHQSYDFGCVLHFHQGHRGQQLWDTIAARLIGTKEWLLALDWRAVSVTRKATNDWLGPLLDESLVNQRLSPWPRIQPPLTFSHFDI